MIEEADNVQVRRAMVAVAGTVGVAGVVAGQAWACTPTAKIVSASPAAAVPGAQVRVAVESVSTQGPVEIRWNSLTGDRLATAAFDGRAYAASVAVPDVAPGVYTLIATADGAGVARTSFEVTAPAGSTATPAAAPSLTSNWADQPVAQTPSGSMTGVVAGSGLLAVGLVSTFAGFAVAAGRRRHALASSPTTRQ